MFDLIVPTSAFAWSTLDIIVGNAVSVPAHMQLVKPTLGQGSWWGTDPLLKLDLHAMPSRPAPYKTAYCCWCQ
jgi:hypothetical protein